MTCEREKGILRTFRRGPFPGIKWMFLLHEVVPFQSSPAKSFSDICPPFFILLPESQGSFQSKSANILYANLHPISEIPYFSCNSMFDEMSIHLSIFFLRIFMYVPPRIIISSLMSSHKNRKKAQRESIFCIAAFKNYGLDVDFVRFSIWC